MTLVRFQRNAEFTIKPLIGHLLADLGNVKTLPLTTMCGIMDRNGSNKNHRQHVIYTPFYDAMFSSISVRYAMEFGIGSKDPSMPYSMNGQDTTPGGSLRGWREAFLSATIFGADIDEKVIFREDRIITYHADVKDRESLRQMWEKVMRETGGEKMQVIVDDAVHEIAANRTCFEQSFSMLDQGGFYVIEDVLQTKSNLKSFVAWMSGLDVDSMLLEIPNDTNGTCSCMAVFRK